MPARPRQIVRPVIASATRLTAAQLNNLHLGTDASVRPPASPQK